VGITLRILALIAGCLIAAAGVAQASTAAATANGLRGYVVVSANDLPVPNGTQRHGSVDCPPGLVPLGGDVNMLSGSVHASVNSSFPTATGWAGDVNNASGLDAIFEVSAICARAPRRYRIVFTTVLNPAGSRAAAFAACPHGSTPLGGGGASSSSSLLANLHSTEPGGSGWLATVNNASASEAVFTAYAVCGRFRRSLVVRGDTVLNPASTQTLSSALCPDGTRPVGGGVTSDSPSLDVNVNGVGPNGIAWDTFVNNASPFDATVTPVVVCAGT
jgi:hypothetical protein